MPKRLQHGHGGGGKDLQPAPAHSAALYAVHCKYYARPGSKVDPPAAPPPPRWHPSCSRLVEGGGRERGTRPDHPRSTDLECGVWAREQELCEYGPAKLPGKEGIDKYTNEDGTLKDGVDEDTVDLAVKYAHYKEDPTGRRTGDAPDPALAAVISKQCAEAMAAVDVAQVEKRVCLSSEMLQGQIDLVGGAITIAYPMGLPDYEPVKGELEDDMDLAGTIHAKEVLDPATAQMWWAGKQMLREGQVLSDYIGKNEKTKLIVKLQRSGGGQPTREPAIDEETQKKMMAFYHKKQEQMKALEDDDDDSFANSSWADPKALQRQFQGMGGGIRMR